MRRSFFILAIILFATGFAQQPSWQAPPKLVVGVVVDQMRTDYIYRFWNNFGEGGFKRLIGEGAFLRDAHYTYIPTVTGPGHASIYTGSTPSLHGIVANERYDRASRAMVYCVKDTTVRGVGSVNAQSSPSQLLATTLADEIERRTDRQGITIGVALKDRSSILPIGRTGDAAYWFSADGSFVSSTWYMKALPKWVQEFNQRKLAERYLNQTWEPLLSIEKYHQVLPDENPYEQPLTAGGKSWFPYNLVELSKGPAGLGLIATTPWGNTLTTDMAIAALVGEKMGQDNTTDLLALSYSSTDILGHKMGPRALEIEDMYVRLDQELARLLTELDKSVGVGKYTVFLTADHGVIDVPQYLKDLKGSAGYIDPRAMQQRLDKAFSADEYERMLRIDTIYDGHVYFMEVPREGMLARVAEEISIMPEVSIVMTSHTARRNTAIGEQSLLSNGFMPQRCGDILYTLKPGYFEAEGSFVGKGTTHGSGWNYDTHVPVIFFGQGVAHSEVVRRTAVADIVPTITMLIGCALPDAAVGEAVREVIAH
ncbi:MAG: alkaline phosphatase family protein [Flavobacteriales bacterium]|nr:alkaline phosphatase family protein [Flavobacteriales bacterium]